MSGRDISWPEEVPDHLYRKLRRIVHFFSRGFVGFETFCGRDVRDRGGEKVEVWIGVREKTSARNEMTGVDILREMVSDYSISEGR